MKLVKLLLPLITLTISAFSVQAQHLSDTSLVAKGAKVYGENCARCHNARPAEEYSKKEWSVVMYEITQVMKVRMPLRGRGLN